MFAKNTSKLRYQRVLETGNLLAGFGVANGKLNNCFYMSNLINFNNIGYSELFG